MDDLATTRHNNLLVKVLKNFSSVNQALLFFKTKFYRNTRVGGTRVRVLYIQYLLKKETFLVLKYGSGLFSILDAAVGSLAELFNLKRVVLKKIKDRLRLLTSKLFFYVK